MRRRYILFCVIMCAVVLLGGMCLGSYRYSEKMARVKQEQKQQQELLLKEELEETGAGRESVITSDTKYIVEIYNADTEDLVKEEQSIPAEYAGLTRAELEEHLENSLKKIQEGNVSSGLADLKLVSFSKNEVVIRKTYRDAGEERGFFLKLDEGEVVIYDRTGQIVYENTGIQEQNLPEEEIEKLREGVLVETEKDLYSILENFSS